MLTKANNKIKNNKNKVKKSNIMKILLQFKM